MVNLYRRGLKFEEIAQIYGVTPKAIDSLLDRVKEKRHGYKQAGHILKPWWTEPNIKIGHLDIETENREANAGFMLSWAIQGEGESEPRHDLITPAEVRDWKKFDKRICKSLLENLRDFDVITTYWGTGFDIPFIRTRCMGWNLPFPEYGTIIHWDLYFKVRSKLRLHRKSLDAACAFFGIEGKTHLDMEMWMKARSGDRRALTYVLDHNIGDVQILQQLWYRLRAHSKWTKTSI